MRKFEEILTFIRNMIICVVISGVFYGLVYEYCDYKKSYYNRNGGLVTASELYDLEMAPYVAGGIALICCIYLWIKWDD